MPRRHGVVGGDFGDHLGPADGFLIAGEREGADLAGPMAFDAALLQDAADLVAISDGLIAGGRQLLADQAADRFGMFDGR